MSKMPKSINTRKLPTPQGVLPKTPVVTAHEYTARFEMYDPKKDAHIEYSFDVISYPALILGKMRTAVVREGRRRTVLGSWARKGVALPFPTKEVIRKPRANNELRRELAKVITTKLRIV